MLDDRINQVKALILKREEIDTELAQLLGVEPRAKRGRPRKDAEPPKEKTAPEGTV
jgi:hypothetical protein